MRIQVKIVTQIITSLYLQVFIFFIILTYLRIGLKYFLLTYVIFIYIEALIFTNDFLTKKIYDLY